MTRTKTTLIYVTVFLTGLFSLVYQTVWQRYLTFLVGADSRSSVITLTVFLTALSIGYYLAGRSSHKIKGKELFYYGVVEFIIGFWALIFPWLFKLSFTWVETGLFDKIFGDVVLSMLLTAIPATLMGTTLPYLTQGLSRSFKSSSKTHASIYAINTIGACVGALLAGFILLEMIGLANSMYLIGALNVSFGLLMIGLSKNSQTQQLIEKSIQASDTTTPPQVVVNQTPLLLVAACSGYLLIAIESYFIRLFSMATDGSIYAYPTVITAFIAAVGIGAALSARLMERAVKIYALIPLIVMFFWILIYFTIPYWPYVDYLLKHWINDYSLLPIMRFILFFLVIALPVIVSSMLLPFSFHFFKNQDTSIGQTTGNLYAVATVATIVGGLIGGYLMFNYFDFQQTFLSHFVVMAIMALSALGAIKSRPLKYLKSMATLGMFFLMLFIIPIKDFNKNLALTYYFQIPTDSGEAVSSMGDARDWLWNWFDYEEIIASSIQAEGMVSVFNKKLPNNIDSRMIAINGRSNSGTTGTDYQGNALLSLFPYIMTKNPKRVLIIGLGTGVTAGAIASQEHVEVVDICEINGAVIDQLPFFDFASFNASTNPKINLIQSDVVKFLLRTEHKYDIIISIPSNFWVAGMENLMTPEFYSMAKDKLNDGGTFVQWIPDYGFSRKGLLMMVKSFIKPFDTSRLWRLTKDDLVLMYHKNIDENFAWIAARFNETALINTMTTINFKPVQKIIQGILADEDMLKQMANLGELHSLNNPNLGEVALQSLYNPEGSYSAENVIQSIQGSQ